MTRDAASASIVAMREKTNSNSKGRGSKAEEDDYAYGCYVYILVSVEGDRSYVGWTTDLKARLAAHNAGKGAKSTRGRQWRMVHSEKFRNKSDAMSREWYLKRDRAFRKKLLNQVREEL